MMTDLMAAFDDLAWWQAGLWFLGVALTLLTVFVTVVALDGYFRERDLPRVGGR